MNWCVFIRCVVYLTSIINFWVYVICSSFPLFHGCLYYNLFSFVLCFCIRFFSIVRLKKRKRKEKENWFLNNTNTKFRNREDERTSRPGFKIETINEPNKQTIHENFQEAEAEVIAGTGDYKV